jgi:hypothetical protein
LRKNPEFRIVTLSEAKGLPFWYKGENSRCFAPLSMTFASTCVGTDFFGNLLSAT